MSEHGAQVERIKTFKKRVVQAQKAGKSASKADMVRLRQYKKEGERLQEELKMIENLELSVVKIEAELEKLYEADLHGKVVHKSAYDGKTQVIFIDVKTGQEHALTPEGIYENIYLIQEDDVKKLSWN